MSKQAAEHRRAYAATVLRGLARTQQGRPVAQVRRLVKDALTPSGSASHPQGGRSWSPTSSPADPSPSPDTQPGAGVSRPVLSAEGENSGPMNHLVDSGSTYVGAGGGDRREFVLLDDDSDRPDRVIPDWGVLSAVAIRVQRLTLPSVADNDPGLEVLVTVANADNETTYLPALEAAGYDLTLRLPGHRVLTLPGCGVRVHVRDDDDPADGLTALQ